MVRRKEKSELEQAEIKLESLIERRNALNSEAAVVREERDLLHDQKKGVVDQVRALRDERDRLVDEMRVHRDQRNEFQRKARDLIELKRRVRGQLHGSIAAELERLRKDVKGMEMRQQTASLKLEEENALLDDLREKLKELKSLEHLRSEQDKIGKEVRDLDGSITDLFRAADKEHELVVKLNEEAKERHEKLGGLVGQISALTADANKKHEEYLKIRTRADELHQKAMEMREGVLTIRNAHRAEIREARNLLRQQNITVRRELLDERKLDKAAEEALQLLMKKGRVVMKG
jgi:uncharacterized coiled-coil DUF342 family protein